jgi:hypothetical protein
MRVSALVTVPSSIPRSFSKAAWTASGVPPSTAISTASACSSIAINKIP